MADVIGGGGGSAAAPNITWSFPGTLSTDQNSNLPKVKIKKATTITAWDVNFVTAPAGGSTVVVFKKNGATVATVTIAAGETFAQTVSTTSFAVDDILSVEVSSVAPTTPGVTALFRARTS